MVLRHTVQTLNNSDFAGSINKGGPKPKGGGQNQWNCTDGTDPAVHVFPNQLLPSLRDSEKKFGKDEYELSFKNNLQNRQMGKMKYEWWKDIGENGSELDI